MTSTVFPRAETKRYVEECPKRESVVNYEKVHVAHFQARTGDSTSPHQSCLERGIRLDLRQPNSHHSISL